MRNYRPYIYSLLVLLMAACASIGNPDGGAYDETPPKVVSCSPADHSTQSNKKKISILFDEFIKMENANEKVVVSPPQIEPANIRAVGKKIKIDLYDTLQANTTYTIDFSDAIMDNNEGNPMGQYTYSFSTGNEIDTMEVSGTILNAENLEPIKGILVGLYPADTAFNDTILRTTPFKRVSRTNGSGRFTIKGVKSGKYHVLALDDKDGDLLFSQKSEMVAFDRKIIETYSKPDLRMDTVWRDSTHWDSIHAVPYTHYFPDDIVLTAFLEEGQDQHLLKTERAEAESFKLYFTAPADSLPVIRGLNFDEKCLVCEASEHNDTLTYWVTDTLYSYQQDTLKFELSYLETDSTGMLAPHTETLEIVPKNTHAKRRKEQLEKIEEWNKARAKKLKKAKEPLPPEENPYEHTYLEIGFKPSGSIDPNQNVLVTCKEPLASVDTTKLHFYIKQDSDWLPAPFLFLPEKNKSSYKLYAEWDFKQQYRFVADSAAFVNVLGNVSKTIREEFKVRGEEEFGSIFIHVIAPDTGIVVQLIDKSDKPVRTVLANEDGRADFFYIKPGDYYLRCFIDSNGNGMWDTGNYMQGLMPEQTFYYPKPLPLKANWELEQDWDIHGIKLAEQKPTAITKQKPDRKKTAKNRNKDRNKGKNGQGQNNTRN